MNAIELAKRLFFGAIPLATARSIRREPAKWTPYDIGGRVYTITHEANVEVWTANHAFGLHVKRGGVKWGDVTIFSAFGLSPGHWLVWSAARWWIKNHTSGMSPILQAFA